MEYVKDWDRETSIVFASMIFGSYTWVMSERIALGIFVGTLAHLALTAIYEACARIFDLPHLSYVEYFEREYMPLIVRYIPRSTLKRQV